MLDAESVTGLVDKKGLILMVDKLVDDIIEEVKEEERSMQLLTTLGYLCYTQGVYAATDRRVGLSDEETITQMYHALCAANERWIVVQDYLAKARSIEVHPGWLLMYIRNMFSEKSPLRYDKCMAASYRKFIDMNEQELEEMFFSNEVVTEPDPELVKDPELITKFMQALSEIKTFHRDRNKYETSEEQEKHDALMSVYRAIEAVGLKIPTPKEKNDE